MKTTPIQPETERLLLRQWTADDLEPFAALNADPEAMRHFPSLLTRAESDAMAGRCAALIRERGWGLWAVERKGGAPFMGFVGLHEPAMDLPFSPCVEIGWRLAPAFWGRGYASEAARAALEVGFARLDLSEIVAFTALSNLRSVALMERLGMVRDPEPFEHPALPPGHPLRPHCLCRLTRDRWAESARD